MLYLGTASGPLVRDAMRAGLLGHLDSPSSRNYVIPGVPWALDNGCFSARWTFRRWTNALINRRYQPGCLFAVVPDVLGNAAATDGLWYRYVDLVRNLGYRPAYVTQNGCRAVPPDAEVVFTGGDNSWKESEAARALVREARERGLWCHMGRVNTRTRLNLAAADGYDSVDGTMLAFGPRKNLPILLRWLRELPDYRPVPQATSDRWDLPHAAALQRGTRSAVRLRASSDASPQVHAHTSRSSASRT